MHPELYKLLLSVILTLVIILVRVFFTRILLKRVARPKTHYNWRKGTIYLSYFIIFVMLITLWIKEFQSAATFLGLLSAGLAIALRDPIINLFGWFHIIFSRPFEVGHRIKIANTTGDVLGINFFEFTLLETGITEDSSQSTGRLIHYPNGKVFVEPVVNSIQGFPYIWHEIPVLITFQSDWQKAKKILLNIENERVKYMGEQAKAEMEEGERKFNIHYTVLTPTVYTKIKEYGIQLTLRFICPPRTTRANEQIIWEEILLAFAKEENIQFAYPSQTVHLGS